MVCLVLAVFFLKALDAKKLKAYVFSLFSGRFLEDETEEDTSFFNPFHTIISLFSMIVLSLLLYNLFGSLSYNSPKGFYNFTLIFLIVFSYFGVKWFLEFTLSFLFKVKKTVRYFLVSKFSYLYSVSFLLFFAIVLVEYSKLSYNFLLYFSGALFLLRFLLHFINNKKLIFSKLFYFILYLCAFEIAPLFILFKLMF